MKTKLFILATSLLAASALPLFAGNSSLMQSPLSNTGVDADASGRVLSRLGTKKSEMLISLSKLDASASYQIEVGGVVEATFVAGKSGKATVKFKTAKSKDFLLDFDPRGKQVRVLSGGQSVLEAVLGADGESAGAVVTEKAGLSLGATAGGTGKANAEYKLDKKGRRTFKVELERAGEGPFALFVGGVKRGDFVKVGTRYKIKFAAGSDDVGVLPLDFDPRGQVIDVIRNGSVVFSSELAAQALGVNVASPRLSTSSLLATAAAGNGHSEVKLRIDDRARKHFSVEIEDVPAGTYDLFVDGENVGSIVVTATTGGTKGEIEFTSGDDDSEELPLTFDPVGKTLTVKQGSTVFFEGVYTPSTGTGGGTPAPEPPSEFEEDLASTGLSSSAEANADYRVDDRGRHKFSVEVEKVPAGEYTLVVAGTVRGTIRAALDGAKVKGEIEFDSKVEPGQRLLNFDPRGQLIEIKSSAGTYFSHVLGGGSASGGGAAVVPFEITVPLISSGVDSNASAKAQLRRKASGKLCFEVEVEDVNVGTYELVVDGTVQGTLNVVTDGNGTRGQLEYETEPDSGELLLNFDVAGKEIVIRKSGTVYFTRVFPQ